MSVATLYLYYQNSYLDLTLLQLYVILSVNLASYWLKYVLLWQYQEPDETIVLYLGMVKSKSATCNQTSESNHVIVMYLFYNRQVLGFKEKSC